jgi:hypothetical protein
MKTENRRAQQTRISHPRKSFVLMLSWFRLSLTPARRRFRALGGTSFTNHLENPRKERGLAVGHRGGKRFSSRGQANTRIRQTSSDTSLVCVAARWTGGRSEGKSTHDFGCGVRFPICWSEVGNSHPGGHLKPRASLTGLPLAGETELRRL